MKLMIQIIQKIFKIILIKKIIFIKVIVNIRFKIANKFNNLIICNKTLNKNNKIILKYKNKTKLKN